MWIRKAFASELDEIMALYDTGRRFMRASGNLNQWVGGYPDRELVRTDIEKGYSHVAGEGERLLAVFALIGGKDPTYARIDGEWLDDSPYHTIHRIAVAEQGRGIAQQIFSWCARESGALRADTHEDNLPMQRALTKFGFVYCGVIYLENGDPRRAYQYIPRP